MINCTAFIRRERFVCKQSFVRVATIGPVFLFIYDSSPWCCRRLKKWGPLRYFNFWIRKDLLGIGIFWINQICFFFFCHNLVIFCSRTYFTLATPLKKIINDKGLCNGAFPQTFVWRNDISTAQGKKWWTEVRSHHFFHFFTQKFVEMPFP